MWRGHRLSCHLHPLYDVLLTRFCKEMGLDATALREMMAGNCPAPAPIVDMMATVYGIPRTAWKKKLGKRASAGLVSQSVSRHNGAVPATDAHRQSLRKNARNRRRLTTPVHAVLDALDWTVADLAQHVSDQLGWGVSRQSMQFYVTGTRQIGPKGYSHSHPVSASLDIREAAEIVTTRAALDKQLGTSAILKPDMWPNVEQE